MEVIVGAIFEFIKIAIQSAVYGLIISLIIKMLTKQKVALKTWLITSSTILISMIIFLNTHWGDHGLGDSRRIPLKYDKEVGQINGTTSGIKYNGNNYLPINEFEIVDDIVFGLTGPDAVNSNPPYFVWNFKNDHITFCNSRNEMDSITMLRDTELKPFYKHYGMFWGGWKFWLLP